MHSHVHQASYVALYHAGGLEIQSSIGTAPRYLRQQCQSSHHAQLIVRSPMPVLHSAWRQPEPHTNWQ